MTIGLVVVLAEVVTTRNLVVLGSTGRLVIWMAGLSSVCCSLYDTMGVRMVGSQFPPGRRVVTMYGTMGGEVAHGTVDRVVAQVHGS